MSNDWTTTTTRVAAVVTLANGEILPGQLHLQAAVARHSGQETPIEMLNRDEGFFPITFDDGTVCFLSRAQVASVTCEWPEDDALEEIEASAHPIQLEVVLVSGESFEGQANVILPAPRSRPLDYVNSLRPFFVLRTESGPRLINRQHVRLARPFD